MLLSIFRKLPSSRSTAVWQNDWLTDKLSKPSCTWALRIKNKSPGLHTDYGSPRILPYYFFFYPSLSVKDAKNYGLTLTLVCLKMSNTPFKTYSFHQFFHFLCIKLWCPPWQFFFGSTNSCMNPWSLCWSGVSGIIYVMWYITSSYTELFLIVH